MRQEEERQTNQNKILHLDDKMDKKCDNKEIAVIRLRYKRML